MTAYDVTTDGIVIPRARNGHRLREAHHDLTIALLESRLAELESRLQEDGWNRLGDGGGREFSRQALGNLTDLARIMYLKNPLVNRAVEVGALYAWGQDLSVNAEDAGVAAVVERFWAENRATLTGQQASRALDVELTVAGNLFLALFADPVAGGVTVRPIPMEEVAEIVCNPEDRYEPWFYRRAWEQRALDGAATPMEAYHPDWRHDPADKPATVGGTPVRWEAPVCHVKVGAFPHWRWGVSELYAALDWARAYVRMLENDATRSAALARFAWKLTTGGGADGVAAAKARLGTTLGSGGGETNPPPVTGSAFIRGSTAQDLDPIRIAGATLPPDHSRPVRLMAAAALGIPDHFFDTDQGNFATSKTMDRPTELRFNERRELWKDLLGGLLQWAIDRDLGATRGLLTTTPIEDARTVDLSWPDLLERSVTERVDAVVRAATMGGQSPAGTIAAETVSRLLLVALGVEDVDAELEQAAAEREERAELAAQIARQTRPVPPEDDDEEREAFVAAVKRIGAALDGR